MSTKEDLDKYRAARADVIAEAELVLRLKEAVAHNVIPPDAEVVAAIRHASVRLGEVTIPAYTAALMRLQASGGE